MVIGLHRKAGNIKLSTRFQPTARPRRVPGNPLAKYLPAIIKIMQAGGGGKTTGLTGFEAAVGKAASDPAFRAVQDDKNDEMYFNPAMAWAKRVGARCGGRRGWVRAWGGSSLLMHAASASSQHHDLLEAQLLPVSRAPPHPPGSRSPRRSCTTP